VSVEFYLEDHSLKQDDWQSLLNTYCIDNDVDVHEEITFHGDVAQVLFPGSIRGFTVNLDSDTTARVRLNSLASRSDWKVAFGVMKQAVDQGGGTLNKEGEPVDTANLLPEHAETECMADFAFALGSLRSSMEEGSAALPIAHFSCRISPGDLAGAKADDPESLLAVEARLQDKVSDYVCAFTASVITATLDDKEVKICNYHHEPTLFHKEVDYVSMHGTSRDVEGLVPREKVEEILVAYLQDAGDFWYLPTINFGGKAELWEALDAVAEHKNKVKGDDDNTDYPALEALAFEMLSAVVGGEGGVGALAVVGGSEHPDAPLVLTGVTAAVEAMNDESIEGNPQKLLNHLVDNDVKPEVATAIVRTIITRGDDLAKAAESGATDADGPAAQKSGCASLLIAGFGAVVWLIFR
jgi:hypothetical protein